LTFNDLKLVTIYFRHERLLEKGGFRYVFKGWIDENGTVSAKLDTGLTFVV
jgi:hypothetical protein